MPDLSHLDGPSLQTFIDTELKDFMTKTQEIRKDAAAGRALRALVAGETTPETIGQNQILALGPMVNDDLTHGKSLVEATRKAAESIDKILEHQERLLKDIDRDFRLTLKHMQETQSNNLSGITGDKMLELLEDVDNSMGPTNSEKLTP
ncbi:type VII secretion system-associated protein [Streptomyces tendae]